MMLSPQHSFLEETAKNWLLLNKSLYTSKGLWVTLHRFLRGMGLISMTILTPTFFRMLEFNEEETEASEWQEISFSI